MPITDIVINEKDLASVLQKKIGELTNLQLQVEALSRTVSEQDAKIAELEGQEQSPNGKEAQNADGRKEEIPVYS